MKLLKGSKKVHVAHIIQKVNKVMRNYHWCKRLSLLTHAELQLSSTTVRALRESEAHEFKDYLSHTERELTDILIHSIYSHSGARRAKSH
jgi:hypothetical protein